MVDTKSKNQSKSKRAIYFFRVIFFIIFLVIGSLLIPINLKNDTSSLVKTELGPELGVGLGLGLYDKDKIRRRNSNSSTQNKDTSTKQKGNNQIKLIQGPGKEQNVKLIQQKKKENNTPKIQGQKQRQTQKQQTITQGQRIQTQTQTRKGIQGTQGIQTQKIQGQTQGIQTQKQQTITQGQKIQTQGIQTQKIQTQGIQKQTRKGIQGQRKQIQTNQKIKQNTTLSRNTLQQQQVSADVKASLPNTDIVSKIQPYYYDYIDNPKQNEISLNPDYLYNNNPNFTVNNKGQLVYNNPLLNNSSNIFSQLYIPNTTIIPEMALRIG
jgi:hypothetical protein